MERKASSPSGGTGNDPMLSVKQALDWATAQLSGMTALLEEVVQINSHTANKAGVDAVGRVFARELAGLGLKVETIAQPGHGDLLLASTPAAGDAGNILLCGHMDTVFPAESPFNWFKSRDGKCFGPGVADMKGGLVVALSALKLLAEKGLLNRIPLNFMLNSDEEIGSPVSGPHIQELAAMSKAGLVFECGGKSGELVTGRKGKLALKLEVSGQAGHAGYPGAVKSSALLELAHKIIALEELNGLAPGLTLNVGKAQGGSAGNVIAEHAEALIDVRMHDAESETALKAELERIISSVQVLGVKSILSRISRRPPMPVSPKNQALFKRLQAAAPELGFNLQEEFRGGVSDANYIASMGAPVLDGLGPIGGEDHSEREYIIHGSLAGRTALAAWLIADLAG
jgi:glutamate carboxypeptidase